jgi:lipopolysaccharide biosynthesis glycosyltransferase
MTRRNAIVFLIDANLFPAAIFQAVRLAALNGRPDTDICIVTDSEKDIALAREFGAPCQLVHLGPATIKVPTNNAYKTKVTYYRAYFPRLLSGEYKKILQIDVDIAIENDKVLSLFDLDMRGHAIAAVRDALVAYSNVDANEAELKSALKNGGRKYLNNGMTLIDPDRFAELGLESRTLSTIGKSPTPLPYANQTAINATLDGDWLELSPTFNMMLPLWKSFVREVCPPSIVHFAGPAKPWHGPRFTEKHSVKDEMERFFPKTPWKGFLARFYNFQHAWKQATATPSPGLPRNETPRGPAAVDKRPKYDMAGFTRYLVETTFADVEQGMTSLDLSKIPQDFGDVRQ